MTASVSGGQPPYTYSWSTGDSQKTVRDVSPDIYDLEITDSEYRHIGIHYSVPETAVKKSTGDRTIKKKTSGPGSLGLDADIKASEYGKNNGEVILTGAGGKEPYSFIWDDKVYRYGNPRRYEAEKASVEIPGHSFTEYFGASDNHYLNFNGKEGSVKWTVEVMSNGTYPVDIIYAGISSGGTEMTVSVNGKAYKNLFVFGGTRPLFTGWETVSFLVELKKGLNTITVESTGGSGANLDYLRVADYAEAIPVKGSERINLKPGKYTVYVSDKAGNEIERQLTVPDVYSFRIEDLKVEQTGPGSVQIVDTLPGYSYFWYDEDAPLFYREEKEVPIARGTKFSPPEPGNYYISAKNELTKAESSNRICISVGRTPAGERIDPIMPFSSGEESIKLWFDSSDLDGDEYEDGTIPERGPFKDWKEKTWRNPGTLFTKYEPNKLNGKGVGGFDNVWLQSIGKDVSGYQTIIMV